MIIRYEIKCRFCKKVTGTLDIPIDSRKHKGKTFSDEYFNIADSRCSDCEVKYGTFKEMEEEYRKKVKDDYEGFIQCMKRNNYKKEEFDKEVKNVV